MTEGDFGCAIGRVGQSYFACESEHLGNQDVSKSRPVLGREPIANHFWVIPCLDGCTCSTHAVRTKCQRLCIIRNPLSAASLQGDTVVVDCGFTSACSIQQNPSSLDR